ncbi:endoribonuclease YBEY, chloroplastic-like isoform X5 [Olea europaea var. sylvestris]|uniref:endoribonuclease YBEY, chloroplastic-like isoform X5 n=1 Tax=Olea europaea var. sylvestris TaxID=158386 RepID=UPI000C1D85C2|nr:endoribonuclease YBEY, chloroplastic-like isoform X5 [Olea europaea var. sylvestris]
MAKQPSKVWWGSWRKMTREFYISMSNSYLSLGSFSFSFSTTSSNSTCKTRDTSISDVGCFESVELSVLLCNAGLIRKLNREWRDEDNVIDILSMSQHIRELKLPITALRRVEEKGHTILDGIEILVVSSIILTQFLDT